LVVAEEDPAEAAGAEELFGRASNALEACRALDSESATPESVKEVLATPLAEWNAAPSAVLASLTLLQRLGNVALTSVAAVAASSESTPFAPELRRLLDARLAADPRAAHEVRLRRLATAPDGEALLERLSGALQAEASADLVTAALERRRALHHAAWRWAR